MTELIKRHRDAASLLGKPVQALNGSVYGGRAWTGPSPDDLSELLAKWACLVNE